MRSGGDGGDPEKLQRPVNSALLLLRTSTRVWRLSVTQSAMPETNLDSSVLMPLVC